MLSFIQSQLLFYISIVLVLFLPGYFLLSAIEIRKKLFSPFERFVMVFGISIIFIDFLLILLGRAGILITRTSLLFSLAIFFLICLSARHLLKQRQHPKDNAAEITEDRNHLIAFSKNQSKLIILIVLLTIFIKTIYLSGTIFPSATDLGHHTFWINKIIATGKLPEYAKSDIEKIDGNYQISEPKPIADFIIGEHLIFAATGLISADKPISVSPTLILYLINIFSILAVFILSIRLFEEFSWGKNAAIIVLFIIGPLYAISSAQAKFVSGGVIGNILGNFFIPTSLYFYWRAVHERKSIFFFFAVLFTFTLFYTHHLSALIFGLILAVFILIFLVLSLGNKKTLFSNVQAWIKLITSPPVLILMALAVIFFFFIYTPSYFKTKAVDTVIGSPTKSTKQGFSFSTISSLTGEARMTLGIIGCLISILFLRKNKYLVALILSWTGVIFIMSWKPGWIHLNIPSVRVTNYLAFPISVGAGFAIGWIFNSIKESRGKKIIIPKNILVFFFAMIIIFIIYGGFFDNSQTLKSPSTFDAVKTFHAAKYLSQKTGDSDLILKDHNFISSDAWMKIYFMKDYNYPLTRSYFFRYDENQNREQCTSITISSPDSDDAKKCYQDLGMNFIVVNPAYDSVQFQSLSEFSRVYDNEKIIIYNRN
jgi:hypothetical protein